MPDETSTRIPPITYDPVTYDNVDPQQRPLPPTWIATGALDLFQPENIDYAKRLISAEVETELIVYPGTIHAFPLLRHIAVTKRFDVEYKAVPSEA